MLYIRLRSAAALAAILTLTGCSYVYDILAIVVDGRIAFIVDPTSGDDDQCIKNIWVTADGDAVAKAGAGDDEQLVANGVFWYQRFDGSTCPTSFPLTYGAPIKGRVFLKPPVAAKPLRVGIVYEVTTAGGGGYGSGWFRINSNLLIENLPGDPTPPDFAEDLGSSDNVG